ncbi:MAG: hypothetical protein Q9219_000693 [cf. Caloplaca sp. 3 TL-2023]
MHFSLSLALLSTSLSTVFSSPLTIPDNSNALVKREDPMTLVTDLYSTVQSHTAVINSTAESLTPTSSLAEKDAAASVYTVQLAAINSAVVAATNQVGKRDLETRQAIPTLALAGILQNVLLDISGALNNIIADLGLSKFLTAPSLSVELEVIPDIGPIFPAATLSFLGPLVGSLSGLLLALDGVVDQLLAVVKQLVDGLLIGLSLALAGLVL